MKLDNKSFLLNSNDIHKTLRLTVRLENKAHEILTKSAKKLLNILALMLGNKSQLEQVVMLSKNQLLAQIDTEIDVISKDLDKSFISIMNQAIQKSYENSGKAATIQVSRIAPQPNYKLSNEDKRIIKMLKNTDFSLIKTLSKRHISDAKQIMVEGLQRGLNQEEIINNLMRAVGNTEYNARRIIRTEITRTANISARKRYLDAGIMYWQWNTSIDERVCEDCAPLHGKVVKIGEAFSMFRSSAITQPPLHPFCRCGVSPAFGKPFKPKKPKVKVEPVIQQKFKGFNKQEINEIKKLMLELPARVKAKVKVLNGTYPIVKTSGRLVDDKEVKAIIPVSILNKYRRATGFYIGNNINRIFIDKNASEHELLHEIGHAIYDEYFDKRKRDKWVVIHQLHNLTGDFISARSSVNSDEHFADALSFYILKPALLKNRFPEIYSFISTNIFFKEN